MRLCYSPTTRHHPSCHHVFGELNISSHPHYLMDLPQVSFFPHGVFLEPLLSPLERCFHSRLVVRKRGCVFLPGVLCIPVWLVAVGVTVSEGQTCPHYLQLFLVSQGHLFPPGGHFLQQHSLQVESQAAPYYPILAPQ